MADWHIVTCEFPPQLGGVSDYARDVAIGLARRGHVVDVWAPSAPGPRPATPGVALHDELGAFGRSDLKRVGRALRSLPKPRRLFVQWVPHGYGYGSMNVGFCLWLLGRARLHGDAVEIMVHESFLLFKWGDWKVNLAAAVHRLMTVILLLSATRVWYTTPAWERQWRPYALGRSIPFRWLPMPSNIPVPGPDTPERSAVRARYAPQGELLIGHFGTFGREIAELVVRTLAAIPPNVPPYNVLLVGPGGERARDALTAARPDLGNRVHATGPMPVERVSLHLRACDVMVQPYCDGVTTRRTSFMAGLALGLPIVTTLGALSEAFWADTGAALFASPEKPAELADAVAKLLSDPAERARLGAAGRGLYQDRFDIRHTVDALHAS